MVGKVTLTDVTTSPADYRFKPGTRDTTFNAGGTGADLHVEAVAMQPDGKIVIGGAFTSYNGAATASDKVMRLNANGTRDTTFNPGGSGPGDGLFLPGGCGGGAARREDPHRRRLHQLQR